MITIDLYDKNTKQITRRVIRIKNDSFNEDWNLKISFIPPAEEEVDSDALHEQNFAPVTPPFPGEEEDKPPCLYVIKKMSLARSIDCDKMASNI